MLQNIIDSKLWILGLGALVLSAGCSRTVVTTIRHPLQTGALDPNIIALTYESTERQRAIPYGALSDEAEITRLDTSAMCFEVTLRDIPEPGQGTYWTDLRNFEVGLDAGDDIRIVEPEITLREPVQRDYQGMNPQEVQTGTRRECTRRADNGDCRRWENRPVYETRYFPGIVPVIEGGGTICFGNGGLVTPETDHVRLVLRRPVFELGWEWEFESIVELTPQS